MSRHASPTVIGTFVVGAIALAVVALVVLGSGKFFQETHPFVCYFTGDVNGLNVGAPVKFKGVDIGAVTRIALRFEAETEEVRIPVFVELDETKIVSMGGTMDFSKESIAAQIDRGLRAQLETQSLVTGLLFVQLDYHPDVKATFVAPNGSIPEIPTIPTAIEQVQAAIKDIIRRLDKVDFQKLIGTVDSLVESATGAARAIDELAGSRELKQALVTLDQTLVKIGNLSDSAGRDLGPLVQSFTATSQRTQGTLVELEGALKQTRSVIAPDSPLAAELTKALQELGSAARAIRQFADFLQRDPSALVRGRDIQR